jgi:hypothetical protein
MVVAATLAVLALAVVAGAGQGGPASTVDHLLTLRNQRSQDATAYAHYVNEEVANALIKDAARSDPAKPALPAWERPSVTEESSASAEVTVVWKKSAQFAKWPKRTIFLLQKSDGVWKVVDARVEDADGSKESTASVPATP